IPQFQVYVPQSQWAWAETGLTLVVKTTVEPMTLAAPVRRIVAELDPRQPVTAVARYEDVIASSMATRRLAAWLLSAFACVAFALAVVGLYGAVSVLVGQRQREIGVRLALGAGAAEIRRMIVAKGMQPVLAGLVLGLAI